MLAELEGKIQSEDLFNEAGQYIGPRILDDEGGFAAEEAMIGDTSSDDDLLSDNASDSEDIDEEGDVPVEQTVEERIKELKIKETPVPKPSRLSKAARKAGWMSASEYSPPSEDLSRKGERVPPTNLEELKRLASCFCYLPLNAFLSLSAVS